MVFVIFFQSRSTVLHQDGSRSRYSPAAAGCSVVRVELLFSLIESSAGLPMHIATSPLTELDSEKDGEKTWQRYSSTPLVNNERFRNAT